MCVRRAELFLWLTRGRMGGGVSSVSRSVCTGMVKVNVYRLVDVRVKRCGHGKGVVYVKSR